MKARVLSDPPKSGQLRLSPFRSFDFDEAIIVLFDDVDYGVRQAVRVPVDAVRAVALHNQHVNGHIVRARPALLSGPGTTDITSLLKAAT